MPDFRTVCVWGWKRGGGAPTVAKEEQGGAWGQA